MGYRKHGSTAIAGLVLASLVAPMAHAESGPWIRYKQGYPSPVQTRVYHRGSGGGSSVVPAIAGFIGGLVVGSQLHSAPVRERVVYTEPVCEERVVYRRSYCPPPSSSRFDFYDPSEDQWYGSLDQCAASARYGDGPHFIVEVDARTGYCWDTYRWRGDNWISCGRNAQFDNCNRRSGSGYGGYDRGGNGGWDRRTYNNRYGDNNRDWNRHDNRGGRGRGRWSDQQGRDDD